VKEKAGNGSGQDLEDLRAQARSLIWTAYIELQEAKFDGSLSERGGEASMHLSAAADCDHEEWEEFVDEVRSAHDILLANSGKNGRAESAVLAICNKAVACIDEAQGPEIATQQAAAPETVTRDALEQDAEPDEGIYWRQEENQHFTLLVGNVPQAEVILPLNVAFIGRDERAGPRLVIPDSRSAFEVVEEHLGIGRVDEIIGTNGKPAAQLRHQAEDHATRFARQHPPAREPLYFLRRAWNFLNRAEDKEALTQEGAHARTLIRAALRDFADQGHWTEQARSKARLASSTLHLAPPEEGGRRSFERAADLDAEKAVNSLEYGRAAEERGWREQQRAWFEKNAADKRTGPDLGREDRER
jgi:hypothetical protein